MFRIGLSGTNWTGKTETIRRFVEEHPELNVEVVSLSALVEKCPFPMEEEQTFEGSQWMIEQVAELCKKDTEEIQFFDRTPIDILAFTLYTEHRTGEKNKRIFESILELVSCFNIIFYLPISNEWPVNVPLRHNKIKFARQIDSYIRNAIDQVGTNAVSLPWDLVERQKMLSEYLSRFPMLCKDGR